MEVSRAQIILVKPVKYYNKTMQGMKAEVLTPVGGKETSEILAGIIQGDTPILYLFIILKDYIMRKFQVTIGRTI